MAGVVKQDVKPLARVENLTKRFGETRAVDGISFQIARGSITALVGESGSGKSTVARLMMRLEEPDAGRVYLDGLDLTSLQGKALREARPRFQMIFQDPHASLNPRMTVRSILEEPLKAQGKPRRTRERDLAEIMERARVPRAFLKRHAHELSGGQRQRVGVARALVTRPRFVIADEPVAALDVSIQAQILDLLREMRRDMDFTLLFISHDLAVVHALCDHVMVMQRGTIVESGARDALFSQPTHPYTRQLLSAAPGRET